MPPRLTFEYNPLSYAYPDDESEKTLFLQTSTDLGLFLYWVNIVFDDGEEVWQVVRLDQRDDHTFKYVYPDLIVVDGWDERENDTFALGVFTRDQREAVLECADDVEYLERCPEQDQSARWITCLLDRMCDEKLVERTLVDTIQAALSLP